MITTIIPTFRRPALLARSIRSVLRQTYPEFQLCVYDNASGDETAAVVAELAARDSRVRYYCHPKNIGSIENFRFGLARIETQYFSCLSDDDVLLPEFYATALKALENYPEAAFAATRVIQMDGEGHLLALEGGTWKEGLRRPPEGLREMLSRGHITWTGTLYRRGVLAEVGTLDPEAGSVADLDFELRIVAQCPFVVCDRPGAVYVVHSGSTSGASRLTDTWPAWLKIIRNITGDERIPEDIRAYARNALERQLAARIFRIGRYAGRQGRLEDAYPSARLLRDRYHWYAAAFAIWLLATVCRWVKPARTLLAWLAAAHHTAQSARVKRKLDPEYRQLLES